MYYSPRPHGLQHARLPWPSVSPGVCSNSCPLNWVMLSNHLTHCHPFLLLPSVFPSFRVFSNELALCIKWPKYWSFSSSISPSSEYSELISFRIDWYDLHAVQGTLKFSLKLQCQEENYSIHDITTGESNKEEYHSSSIPLMSAFSVIEVTVLQWDVNGITKSVDNSTCPDSYWEFTMSLSFCKYFLTYFS